MNRYTKSFLLAILFTTSLLYGDNYPSQKALLQDNLNTPAVGPLPSHDVDVMIDVAFLYWFAKISNLCYAVEGVSVLANPSSNPPQQTTFVPTEQPQFDASWGPGVRLGSGVITNHDGWEAYADWTYFGNSTTACLSAPPFENSNFNPNGLPRQAIGVKAFRSSWFLTPNNDFFNRIQSKWAVYYNQIDLELARKFFISSTLTLRPYMGVRGFWSRLLFYLKGTRPLETNATFLRSTSHFKQKNWGVGLLTGLDTAWHMTKQWSLFGEGAAAITYGKQWIKRKSNEFEVNQQSAVIRNNDVTTRDDTYSAQPILDLAMGVRWENAYSHFRLLFDAGWEFHFFIDLNNMFRGTGATTYRSDLISTDGNLTLSGVRVRGRVEF